VCLEDDCKAPEPGRRDFVLGIGAALTGLGVSGLGWAGEQQPPTRVLDHPAIQHERVTFRHGGKETFAGFLARPKGDGAFPPVLVIAGNRITEEYIPNTCAALAVAGFVGLAPDVFHPLPEGARTREEMTRALAEHTESDVIQDVQAGADYLRTQSFVKAGGIGVLGFCFGGRMALLLAARSREVDAVVAFHPGVTIARDLSRLAAPVQIHHGTADRSVDVAKSRQLADELKAEGKPVELLVYDGADHGFLAYTRPTYRPEDAKLAWTRAVGFLKKHLPA
jgi:carboxymethylenebutenolidase